MLGGLVRAMSAHSVSVYLRGRRLRRHVRAIADVRLAVRRTSPIRVGLLSDRSVGRNFFLVAYPSVSFTRAIRIPGVSQNTMFTRAIRIPGLSFDGDATIRRPAAAGIDGSLCRQYGSSSEIFIQYALRITASHPSFSARSAVQYLNIRVLLK